MKAKYMGDFNKNYGQPMGNILLDQGLAIVGQALQTDQATKDQAVQVISNTVKEGIMENKELLIFGVVMFAFTMAATNTLLTYLVFEARTK